MVNAGFEDLKHLQNPGHLALTAPIILIFSVIFILFSTCIIVFKVIHTTNSFRSVFEVDPCVNSIFLQNHVCTKAQRSIFTTASSKYT